MCDLRVTQTRIDFYQKQLHFLYDNKPFWFQKNALKEYYKKVNFFEERIMKIYINFEKEIEFDMKILNHIENKR